MEIGLSEVFMSTLDRMKDSDIPNLRKRCKEYFWLWLTTNESIYLVSYRTHFNLLNKYLEGKCL